MGGSETKYLNFKGIKVINLGIGMEMVHTNNEFKKIEDLVQTVRFVLAIIKHNTVPGN